MSHVAPGDTPNVVISNPTIRKGVNVLLGVAGVLVTIAWIVDGAIPELDYAFITDPAIKILIGVGALFGLAVTTPNVPRR